MALKTIFEKPVDRPIEGVIKADDEASLRLEIEEYVLTKEVEKRLEAFLDAYNNYEGANGVWVSGFFGSGKSHLLKMLALLLENRQIDGVSAPDLFLPKCADNEILRADLKRAVSIPSKSILFNIDQKSTIISKTEVDALLAVFVKVFDEMCGYYGKQGHIAQFERDLDSRNIYDLFKDAYQKIAGRSWSQGREQAILESKNIAVAYSEVTGEDESSALGILDKYRSQYHVSIEDFAEQVHVYIEKQPANFRLNFFVDEVGQYIAENVKLMTNLQTIAESLATKSRGRAWIVVTSQNDMEAVLGEMNKQQSNDFSKIMARFKNKMLLTSTNVSEVIQKRLLLKTEDGTESISKLYHQQSNNFGTLFSFTDGSRDYKTYRDKDDFIRSYPFVPYQFDLFQSAIENLSRHNAFEGKHSSVGERSMLGVFQQVAIQIKEYQIGQLASFALMFEGIHTALKSQTQKSILAAKRQLGEVFALQVLKALFLVKYVKEFKPTIRNICVLMLDSFDQDLPKLRDEVDEALNLLEQQTYIQRNGDLYEYLTDEEKDVEEEIKNTEVETTDINAELEKIIFDSVLKHRKIRYEENGQDYPFSKKLDDCLYGREHELAIHVISPFHEQAEHENLLVINSTYKMNELFVLMPPDERLVRDILMYKRCEKYIRQNISVTQQEAVKRILTDKGFQNRERYSDIKQGVQRLLGKAKLFVAGSEIELGSEDANTRITQAFHELISRSYPNLRMLRGVAYTEKDIAKYLNHSQQSLFGNDVATLAESEQEMLAHIQSNNRGGVRTTIKNLLEKFERKPYGWYYAAILCTLANLCARGKVEVKTDGNPLESEELERALRNTHGHGNVIIEPQVEFTASQVRGLKEFYEDFFDSPPRASEAKELGKETGQAIQEMIEKLIPLEAQKTQYPFMNGLSPVLVTLKELTGKPYTWYLIELTRQEDTLLDMKEGIIDPIIKFWEGPQRSIFDRASKFAREQEANFSYLQEIDDGSGPETREDVSGDWRLTPDTLLKTLSDPQCFKNSTMQRVKTLVDHLDHQVNDRIEAEKAKANDTIKNLQQRLSTMEEFQLLNTEQQDQLCQPFTDCIKSIEQQRLIAVIRDTLRRFEETEYHRQLSKLTSWAQPEPKPELKPKEGADKPAGGQKAKPKGKPESRIEYVPSRSVKVSFDKAWLADEDDVESYLQSMREALLEEIKKGKRIQI